MDSRAKQPRRASTVWAAVRAGAETLRSAGAASPRLDAELLMAHVLGWDRTRLLGRIRDSLPEEAETGYSGLVRRRASGEPLQYLTGEREFFGLRFKVTPAVLIPRPETELLVETAVELAKARHGMIRCLDVGTGSGCIAVSFVHEAPAARCWATDASCAALQVARENAARLLRGAARIEFVCADLLECFGERAEFDLILSNPPYVSTADAQLLPPSIRDFEPLMALHAGASGLEIYRRLVPQAGRRLASGGCLLLEAGAGQASHVAALAEQAHLRPERIVNDLQGIPRCVVARSQA
jgi:release factor glutamine methyltransferase